MRILVIDLETAPHIAYVWGAWKQNIGYKQMVDNSYIMSFAAKWLGEDEVFYCENRKDNEQPLLVELLKLLDKADIVIAHNAKKFDIPTLQGRAAVLGLQPPSPFKVIDTLLSARKHFRLAMNTLAYLAEIFGCAPKKTHEKFPGFELWLECLKQNDEAWEEMKTYNIQDVVTLEEVYLKMRAWIYPHPNVANMEEADGKPRCPRCGGRHVHWRGYYHTNVQKYRRFRCMDCGGWGKERFTARERGARREMLVGV